MTPLAGRRLLSVLIVVCLLATPVLAAGGKGQKNYKQGLAYEAAQQWERAAEEFALAAAVEPSNVEYQLHYRRAVFNASQSLTQKGRELAERGDYVGAYNAFRRAYGYDPVNELALSMMERMQRMQLGQGVGREGGAAAGRGAPRDVQISPTLYEPGSGERPAARPDSDAQLPPTGSAEKHQVITYSGDLGAFIRFLAKQIKLNTVFDRDFPQRTIQVDLEEVTPAQTLDYIFLSQGLFYQKLNRRTILVADQSKRPQYMQLVLRTFYLSNVDPNDAKTLIQSAIPPQAGRQPVITPNKATNSLTVRDTPENVRLISDIIKGIDKERAEVVMDVNIFEVSRTELMQFGNQLGSDVSLSNLGGIQKGLAVIGGSRSVVTQGLAAVAAPTALGAALIVPATQLQMLQRRSHTRLVASTQVHAFDGEKSTAHMGQRVPVQTAAVTSLGSNAGNGDAGTQPGVTTGLFGSNGFPVIQYEKTGLTLEFTPQVFPNLDVQVKMSITSNDVTTTQGGPALTPTFTERNIEGTARIQNNRTMLIASVAQNQQSRGREGLPVLGLLPILGRLFTAPRADDRQTDIVIAVTPHVMRAPTVTPSDEEEHPSGTLQTPTSNTLEAMLQEDAREEQLIAARALPKDAYVEVRDADPHTFIPAPRELAAAQAAEPAPRQPGAVTAEDAPAVRERVVYTATDGGGPRPPSDQTSMAFASPGEAASAVAGVAARSVSVPARGGAELRLSAEQLKLRAGERRSVRLLLKTDAPLGVIAGTLRYDPRVIAVRSVTPGALYGDPSPPPTVSARDVSGGALSLSVTPGDGAPALTGAGVLVILEVEALASGESGVGFDEADLQIRATDGRELLLKMVPCRLSVE